MDKQLHDILNALYEAEGLIELALRRGTATHPGIVKLAAEKCYQVADLAAALPHPETVEKEPDNEAETKDLTDVEDVAENLFLEKVVPAMEVAGDNTSPATDTAETEKETGQMTPKESSDTSDIPETEDYPSMQQLIEGSQQEEYAEKEAAEAESEQQADAESEAEDVTDEAAEADEAAPDPEPVAEPENLEEAEVAETRHIATPELPDSENLEEEDSVEEYDPADEEDEQDDARAYAPRNRKPIATFFSINDKYRFRRELFANSNPEWLNALALLETMEDMHEADDYLFNDLQWDPESEDVKAFISVLQRYYQS